MSTLAKSFGSVGGLYRKLKKKTKNTKKGIKEDIKQEIEDHLPEHGYLGRRETQPEDHRYHRSQSRSHSKHRRDQSCDSGKKSIEHASEIIRAEYDRGYHHIGEKYAVGDCMFSQNRVERRPNADVRQ